jgi:LuxR family maltose regulon positive regulatory protein
MSGETTSIPLLRTKLHRPPVADDHLHRQRLLNRLEKRLFRPLTLISAPAGYGKSTLMSCWLETCDLPSAWVSLDDGDNDLRMFLSYFLAAVRSIFSGFGRGLQFLLETSDLPPVSVLLRTLINELDRVDKTFILVLDDYHVIQESVIHRLFDELLRHPPESLHLALVSRQDPPFPITKLRARGQMTEIRAQELRFSSAETSAFFHNMMGTPLDDNTVSVLEEKTEGWVTGLRLAALTFRHYEDSQRILSSLPENNQYIMDYFIEEVISQQPEAIREYLLKTAILNRFNDALCRAVCAQERASEACDISGEKFINWLNDANLFVIPLDDENRWFRYHHLFQKVLKGQLKRRFSPKDIDKLHKFASAWFAENGSIEEALWHALEGGDTDAAARVVIQNRHDAMNREQLHRLNRWLQKLPPNIIHENPGLLLSKAWVYQRQARYAEVFGILDRLKDTISLKVKESTTDGNFYYELQALKSFQHFIEGHGELSVASAQEAIEGLPSKYRSVRGFALIVLAGALQMCGDLEKAHRVVYEALQREEASNANYKARLLAALCFTNWIAADLKSLKRTAAQYLKHGLQNNLPETIAVGRYFNGIVHYQRNDLDQAESSLTPVVDNHAKPSVVNYIYSAIFLSLTFQAKGLATKAIEIIEAAADYLLETKNTSLLEICKAFQAELALRQGCFAEADFWARNYHPEPLMISYRYYTPQVTLAKVLLARGSTESHNKAHRLLSRLHAYYSSIHNIPVLIDIPILQALLHDARGEESEALEKLTEAIALAEPGGLIRSFLDLGPEMADVLCYLVKQNPVSRFTEKILAAYSSEENRIGQDGSGDQFADRPSSYNQDQFVHMTNREIEILTILAKGLSNNEIAKRLFISPETVKRHLYNVYQKFNVKNRHQAVSKAKSLGIL